MACLGMIDVPWQAAAGSVNDRILVVRLQCKTRGFLFSGDIGNASGNRLIRAGIVLRSDVLLAPRLG
ncbi:MAG: hypothetical protein FWF31_06875 [Desulfobulbus sp.]|nr:hypothetical protein [Desulfobulbus sp.]